MRTGIFIDGVSLFHGLNNKTFNFNTFKKWVSNNVTYAGYFNCTIKNKKMLSFFSHVHKSGFDLYIKNPVYVSKDQKYVLHGMDTELIIRALDNINKYDKFVLVSGKHDFLPLCEYLTLKGKQIEIISFENSMSKVLVKYDKRYIEEFLK
jgi:hypothetical protein